MKPGRELDALIAEKVIGWIWCPYPVGEKWCAASIAEGNSGYWISSDGCTFNSGRQKEKPNCPHYSTGIAAAWEVVEKMQSKGYRVEIVLGSAGDAYAHFINGGVRFRADSASAPHAICLAALKAVGVEIEENRK